MKDGIVSLDLALNIVYGLSYLKFCQHLSVCFVGTIQLDMAF